MTDTPLWTAAELVTAVQGAPSGHLANAITGISIDSRTLEAGEAFIALVGPTNDGHDYVEAALARGAAAAIVSRVPTDIGETAPLVLVDDTQGALERLGNAARLRSQARIAAVTGSVGKTGTKEALARALAGQGRTHWSVGGLNNQWGVPLSLARLPRDAAYAVFELGMNHTGEIAALSRQVRPDVAIVTTVEAVHLEFFDGIEAIADAKAEIFLGMSGFGTAILNRDNPMYARLAAAATARGLHRIVSFGRHDDADVRLLSADLGAEGSLVTARLGDAQLIYRLTQPGLHLVLNSLAVLAAVEALGADPAAAAAVLGEMTGMAGRGKRSTIDVAGGTATLIDESYNASPASMRAALAVLGHAGGTRRIVVLGDMRELGTESSALHRELAQPIVEAGIDLAYACGPLMRHMFDALPAGRRGEWRETAAELAAVVLAAVRPGDVVTIKGSFGMRMVEIVKPLLTGAASGPTGGTASC